MWLMAARRPLWYDLKRFPAKYLGEQPVKKSEQEAHHRDYSRLMSLASQAERSGLYQLAVSRAIDAWPHIDGMLQYERKYGDGEPASVAAIDLVLRHAPELLDYKSLDSLAELLADRKRIDTYTVSSLTEKLSVARERLAAAHQLWDHIERVHECRQDELRSQLGGSQEDWRALAEGWERMGLLDRVPAGRSYHLEFTTRLNAVVHGKCPSCGKMAEAPKAMFLEELTCPSCEDRQMFVIQSDDPTATDDGDQS